MKKTKQDLIDEIEAHVLALVDILSKGDERIAKGILMAMNFYPEEYFSCDIAKYGIVQMIKDDGLEKTKAFINNLNSKLQDGSFPSDYDF